VPALEFLDTSVVVRYLTNDPPDLADRAARLIASSGALFVTDTALAEAAHVLRTVYGLERSTVIDLLQRLIRDDGVRPYPSAGGRVLDGLELCRPSRRVSVPDSLIWAAAASAGVGSVIYTFDRRFPSPDIDRREPPP
jgi:predicted nucleic acid-binding protein